MTKDVGRPGGLSQQAAEPEEVSALRASIPDAIAEGRRLIKLCECGSEAGQRLIITDVANFLFDPDTRGRADAFLRSEAYMDAAIALLPRGAMWRRYTDDSCAVYAASPYNAKAQVRYDGYNVLPSLAISAAHLQMFLAPLVKAQAIEARRAATVKQGAVHESAVAKPCAQKVAP